jgi:hypothetical protein
MTTTIVTKPNSPPTATEVEYAAEAYYSAIQHGLDGYEEGLHYFETLRQYEESRDS